MKVSQLLERRRTQWNDLDKLCQEMERRRLRRVGGVAISRFAALYRAACADLALADAYQLPPDTVQYLHELVGRAHNQLYRSQKFRWREWSEEIFVNVPRRLLGDRTLWLAFAIFWGIFFTAMYLGYRSQKFCEDVVGEATLDQMREMYSQPVVGRQLQQAGVMEGFYVWHNAGIGLRCFAGGLVFGFGGLFITVSNAIQLGVIFGYMASVEERINFLQFVTAHGPFELTAIVFSSAAGMRLGFSLVSTGGLTRLESLRRAMREATPTMAVAVLLFCGAAVIEAFISPSSLPYPVKAGVAIVTTLMLLFYVVGLGLAARRA